MSRLRRGRQTFVSLVFCLAVVSLAIWAGQFASQTVTGETLTATPAPSLSLTPHVITSAISPSLTSGLSAVASRFDLILQVKSGQVSQLVRFNPETAQRSVVYTDQGESLKIKQVGNLSGHEALVLLAPIEQEFGGSLWAIALDGTGVKTELIAEFTSPWPPVFSPDGRQLAYVSFSNNATGASFALILADRTGQNPKTLVRDSAPLTQPVFSPDGRQLAYVRQGSGQAIGEILTVPVTGGSPKSRAIFANRAPYDLAWNSDDGFAFVDGPGQQADLFELVMGTTEPKRLSGFSGQEGHPSYRPDGQVLAFTERVGSKATLYLLDRTTGSAKSAGSATLAVGWLERTHNE